MAPYFRVYLDSNKVLGQPDTHIKACSLELVALELRFYGAALVDTLDRTVSHVVVDSAKTDRVKSLRDVNKTRSKKFHIVTEDWVSDCIRHEKILQERHYEPAV